MHQHRVKTGEGFCLPMAARKMLQGKEFLYLQYGLPLTSLQLY